MKKNKVKSKSAVPTPEPRYQEDKPKDCQYCYFWLGKKRGCELDQCYYLVEEKKNREPTQEEKQGNCNYCPYGKHSPCLGFCLAKILLEMKQK